MTTADTPPSTTPPAAPPKPKVWFPALDGLRAVAALLVVVFHTSGSVAYFAEPLRRLPGDTKGIWTGAEYLARFGNWGVAIFFLLSGFLLYRPFVAGWFAGKATGAVGPYLARRLIRIVPAYWLALSFYLFFIRPHVFHAGPPPGGTTSYFLFYGFAQIYKKGYVDQGGGLSVAWTLCIEMSFYLVLPLLAWALRLVSPAGRPLQSRVRAQLGVLAAIGLVSTWVRRGAIMHGGVQPYWLHTHMAWFAIGMAFAVWHAAWTEGARLPAALRLAGRYPELCWLFGLQAFWLTTRVEVRQWVQTANEQMAFFIGNGASAALFLAPLVFGPQDRGPLRQALSRFPMKWLGEISYGIYLWHTIWIVVVAKWVQDDSYPGEFWARLVLVLLMTFAIAQLSLLLLERPLMQQVQRRLAGSDRPPRPAGGSG